MKWEKLKFWNNFLYQFYYSNEKYLEWENINTTIISRKLENETCFDRIVKIYSLRTNKTEINKLCESRVEKSLKKERNIFQKISILV